MQGTPSKSPYEEDEQEMTAKTPKSELRTFAESLLSPDNPMISNSHAAPTSM